MDPVMHPDLYAFCRLFHQDFDLYGDTGQEIIACILRMLGPERSERLTRFLAQTLAGDMTDHDLAEMWERSPADIRLVNACDYRPFLGLIRDMAGRLAPNRGADAPSAPGVP